MASLPPHGYIIDMGDMSSFFNFFFMYLFLWIPFGDYSKLGFAIVIFIVKLQHQAKEQGEDSRDNRRKEPGTRKKGKRNRKKEETQSTQVNKPASVLEEYYKYCSQKYENSKELSRNESSLPPTSIHPFVGMSDYLLLLDSHNPFRYQPMTASENSLTLVTTHGKCKVDISQEYMRGVRVANCDLYVIPSEDVLSCSSANRCSKNVKRTVQMLDQSIRSDQFQL
ncbi:hypothetical protein RFI_15518, partial [Reticulomyxa filosa]